ncbi:MAG: hypothetical protein IKX94_05330, partial [Muribaculaceae bacterium]|nr:hypothetical protein [Muribaculaceae bacterium]
MKTNRILLALSIVLFAATSLAQTGIEKVIDDVRKTYAPDKRQAILDINYKQTEGALFLSGSTSEQAAHDAIISRLDELG